MGMSLSVDLVKACLFALEHNLNLCTDEKVLIITDEEKRDIGDAFEDAALTISSQVEMQTIPVLEFSGQEPPSLVADKMCLADVILMPLSKSLSWTEARRRASENGARIISMPGITAETVLRTFPQDYSLVRARVNCICDLLDKTDSIRVATDKGTELTFSVKGREGRVIELNPQGI